MCNKKYSKNKLLEEENVPLIDKEFEESIPETNSQTIGDIEEDCISFDEFSSINSFGE